MLILSGVGSPSILGGTRTVTPPVKLFIILDWLRKLPRFIEVVLRFRGTFHDPKTSRESRFHRNGMSRELIAWQVCARVLLVLGTNAARLRQSRNFGRQNPPAQQ